ncbi:hypothetical protein CR513_07457, partial [Mucuna pruriens]
MANNISHKPIQIELDVKITSKNTKMLCISVIHLWLMNIHQIYLSRGSKHIYGFINLLPLQSIGSKPIVIQNTCKTSSLVETKSVSLAIAGSLPKKQCCHLLLFTRKEHNKRIGELETNRELRMQILCDETYAQHCLYNYY